MVVNHFALLIWDVRRAMSKEKVKLLEASLGVRAMRIKVLRRA